MKHVAKALLMYDDKFLILKQTPNKDGFSFWENPGGKVEVNESPDFAVLREILEETGIHAKVEEKIREEEILSKDNRAPWTRNLFLCSCTNDVVSLSHEHVDFKWVTEGEIESMEGGKRIKVDLKIYQDFLNK